MIDSKGIVFFVGFLLGVALSILIFSGPVMSDGYKQGQLDYQRGKIKYELTEAGYKEIVEVKP